MSNDILQRGDTKSLTHLARYIMDDIMNKEYVITCGNHILRMMRKETILDEIKIHTATLFHSAIMKYKIDEEIRRRCQESLQ